jgi:hypothetical protein
MRRARRDAGFTLAGLICVLSAAAITAAVMVPLRAMESKREMEKELIFRGEEYVRAIQKYQRKYPGTYPAAVEDLLSRDGFRFLRKQYKDPISGEDFRLINVNSDYTLTGSVTMLSLPVPSQPRPGAAITPGSIAGGNTPGALPTTGQNPNAQSNNSANTNNVGGMGGLGGSMGLGSNAGLGGGGQNNNANRPAGVGNSLGSGVGTGTGAFGGGGNAFGTGGALGVGGNTGQNTGQNTGNAPSPGGFPGGGGPGGPGAASAIGNNPLTGTGGNANPQITPGVAGVGSQSTGTAVMVYNTKEKYNEWEFITPLEQTATQSGGAAPPLGGGQGGGQGNQNRPPQGNGQNANPFGNPFTGSNSLGTGGGTTGFGGGSPLGVGTPAPPSNNNRR